MSETSLEHKSTSLNKLNYAIFVCSTSRYNQKKKKIKDVSGDNIKNTLIKSGNNVILKKIIPDDKNRIINALKEALESSNIHAIIFSGGTGINPNDITIETISPYLEKTLPGFGEIFRTLSYNEIGSAAVLSRALAGIACGKIIYCIPGSPNAVKIAVERLILSESAHIVKHIRE